MGSLPVETAVKVPPDVPYVEQKEEAVGVEDTETTLEPVGALS